MKNKILILMMSCNKDLYEKEELACRETFLKDAEGAGIHYYFYKGGEEQVIDTENHTMFLRVSDGLGGTSIKTVLALNEALKMDDWDYVIKTNVSTWLDVKKIQKAVNAMEGREDFNIYGARFLVNKASKNVPFPRDHFTILSRSLVESVVRYAPSLIKADGFPKTDDTLICLALLYHIQKASGKEYLGCLKEMPSVMSWTSGISEAQEWTDALSVRCKDEETPDNTPDNMRAVHALKNTKNLKRSYTREVKLVETPYGLMSYGMYDKVMKILSAQNQPATEPEKKEEPRTEKKQTPVDKLAEIRKKLEGKR